jgi:hypothetical protein
MNPFQPPTESSQPVVPGVENIELVAAGQKMIIYAILINIGVVVFQKVAGPIIGLLAITALVLSIWGVFRLSAGLGMSLVAKVVLAVCMCIPLVNLIVLLVLNSKATRALRAAGYRVGLLGASK